MTKKNLFLSALIMLLFLILITALSYKELASKKETDEIQQTITGISKSTTTDEISPLGEIDLSQCGNANKDFNPSLNLREECDNGKQCDNGVDCTQIGFCADGSICRTRGTNHCTRLCLKESVYPSLRDGVINGNEFCDQGENGQFIIDDRDLDGLYEPSEQYNDDVFTNDITCDNLFNSGNAQDSFNINNMLSCEGSAYISADYCNANLYQNPEPTRDTCGNNILSNGEACENENFYEILNTCNDVRNDWQENTLDCSGCEIRITKPDRTDNNIQGDCEYKEPQSCDNVIKNREMPTGTTCNDEDNNCELGEACCPLGEVCIEGQCYPGCGLPDWLDCPSAQQYCANTCSCIPSPKCGNGDETISAGEECEIKDASDENDDIFLVGFSSCEEIDPRTSGRLKCSNGNLLLSNGNTIPSCTLSFLECDICGNGKINLRYEECDDGIKKCANNNPCTDRWDCIDGSECTATVDVDAPDDPNSGSCIIDYTNKYQCKNAFCGDNYRSPLGKDNTVGGNDDEECDDGPTGSSKCTNDCKLTFCGDGLIQNPNGEGVSEDCDDGNDIDTDQCPNTCKLCGNGVVDVDKGEDCDGSNLNGETCQSLGLSGEILSCDETCKFDTTFCDSPPEECPPQVDYCNQHTSPECCEGTALQETTPAPGGSCQWNNAQSVCNYVYTDPNQNYQCRKEYTSIEECTEEKESITLTYKITRTDNGEPCDCNTETVDIIDEECTITSPCSKFLKLPFFTLTNLISMLLVMIVAYMLLLRASRKIK